MAFSIVQVQKLCSFVFATENKSKVGSKVEKVQIINFLPLCDGGRGNLGSNKHISVQK